jgi:hypothetical protein
VLGLSDYGDRFEVERDTEEADLVVEFSVCRQLGRSHVIGPVPDEWVDEVGAAVLTRWKTIGDDAPDRELMALTACRIWRFREERVHCSKRAAAQWARERGADVAYDDAAGKNTPRPRERLMLPPPSGDIPECSRKALNRTSGR